MLAPTLFSLQIPPFDGVDPAGLGFGLAPHKLNFTWETHPKEQFLFAGPRPILIANTPIWWSGPCGPEVGESTPQIEIYQATHPKEQLLFAGPHTLLIANTPI